jgi:hypothetical protein
MLTEIVAVSISRTLLAPFLLGMFLLGICPSGRGKVTSPQQVETQSSSKDESDQVAINTIIRDALGEGAGVTTEGVKFQTCSPPSKESLAAVKRMGERAIPILKQYLWSQDSCESRVAMRLLGSLGSKSVVAPLAEVARKHPIAGRRMLALRWLSSAPWESVSPVLQESAERDPDPSVRNVARKILTERNSQ